MSGNKIIIDTNIVIYFLLGHKEVEKYFYNFHPVFSFVTELELLSGKDFHKDELADIKNFLSRQDILAYLPGMRDIIIEIRNKKRLKLPNAIIAATAIYFDIPLLSSDKAFINIDGLSLIYNEPPIL